MDRGVMMDIKIGEYFRTENGEIAKVLGDDGNRITTESYEIYFKNEIVKHSFDIMDLIEAGDYVNGRRVYQVGYNFQDDFVCKMSNSNYEDFIYPNEIKTIVTKEQFQSVSYEV